MGLKKNYRNGFRTPPSRIPALTVMDSGRLKGGCYEFRNGGRYFSSLTVTGSVTLSIICQRDMGTRTFIAAALAAGEHPYG